jgi:hypothetical protein
VATATAINFIGACITATDAGGGQANITLDCAGGGCLIDNSLIGAAGLATDAINAATYNMWIGRNPFGWTNGYWNAQGNTPVAGTITSIQASNLNCGIHLPHDLFPGDKIKFCGSSFMTVSPEELFPVPALSVTLVQTNCENLCSITKGIYKKKFKIHRPLTNLSL